RHHYRANRGLPHTSEDAPLEMPCLWADEFGVQTRTCADDADFAASHARFVERRVGRLQAAAPLRMAELLPVAIDSQLPEPRIHAAFAGTVREACLRLHRDHAEADPGSGKRVSFGIVRMANIEPMLAVARALIETRLP